MDWLLKHVRQLLLVAIPVGLGVLGYFGYQKWQVSQRNERLEELGQAQVAYEAEERKAQDQRQALQKDVDAIETKINAAAAPKAGAEAKPADPQLAAQKQDLEKKIEAIKAEHSASMQLFQEYFKKHEKQPEGWMAGMTAARLLLEQGKLAEAAPLIESVLSHSQSNAFYQTQARLTYVSVLEEQGNYDKALSELDLLDKQADKDLQPRLLLARGRLQFLKNAKTEAQATFNNLIENHGTSPEAQKARSIQALLN